MFWGPRSGHHVAMLSHMYVCRLPLRNSKPLYYSNPCRTEQIKAENHIDQIHAYVHRFGIKGLIHMRGP